MASSLKLFLEEVLPLTCLLFIPGYLLATHFTWNPKEFIAQNPETWKDILSPLLLAHGTLVIGHLILVFTSDRFLWLKLLVSFSLPSEALIAIPLAISRSVNRPSENLYDPSLSSTLSPIGLTLMACGLYLLAETNRLFFVQGNGTLSPINPPKNFVATGPYRFVRNPMILGVLLVSLGESIFFNLQSVAKFTTFFFLVHTLYLIADEEPRLKQRFGTSYEHYFGRVRRWVPSLIAYQSPENPKQK